MKIVKKALITLLTITLLIFSSCWAMATISRVNIGEKFSNALINGFDEIADQFGDLIGIGPKRKVDVVLNFKNGGEFSNTHISW